MPTASQTNFHGDKPYWWFDHSSEAQRKKALRHGHTWSGGRSITYRSWLAMRDRCRNTKHKRFYDYGGRGIKVCERWLSSFENFLADMGEKPTPKHSIDRIDNDGNYEPGNCRWATSQEQKLNKRRRKDAKR